MIDIKAARQAVGMTQRELANIIGVHWTRISKIERGEIKMQNITLITAYKLANALNIDMTDLVDWM